MISAFILHTFPWRESSLVVEAFTKKDGRLALIAKGARRARSANRGLLQPFNKLVIKYSKSGDLRPLMSAEWDGNEKITSLNGEKLFSGFYINELILRLIQKNDPCPEFFETYESTLSQLCNNYFTQEAVLRRFEVRLLKEMGLFPDFVGSFKGGFSNINYFVSSTDGVIAIDSKKMNENKSLLARSRKISTESMKILSGEVFDLKYWSRVITNKKTSIEIKNILKVLLDDQLDFRELKSRKILMDLNLYKKPKKELG